MADSTAWYQNIGAIAQRTLGVVMPSLLSTQAMQEALRSDQGRKASAVNAGAAYAGAFPEPLRIKDDLRDTIRTNAIRPLVLATVAYLFGEPPSWDLPRDLDPAETPPPAAEAAAPAMMPGMLPPAADAPPGLPEPPEVAALHRAQAHQVAQAKARKVRSPQEAWMDECLRCTNWPARLLDLGINGAIYGTPYLRLREADADHAYPYVQVLAPENMTIQTDPLDIERVTGYCYQIPSDDPVTHLPGFWRQRMTRAEDGTSWTIVEERASFEGDNWRPVGDPIPWPYPWAPIIHCQNLPNPNQVYGLADVTETLVEQNLALNLSFTASARIERKHASPRQYIKGIPSGTKLNLAIGAIWELPAGADVGQLAPEITGESGQHLRAEIKAAMCEEAQTPALVLGRPEAIHSDPSGVALKVKMWPMTFKTNMKRILYGALIVETLRRLWELGDHGDDLIASLSWKEQIPADPLAERNALEKDRGMGVVSLETLASKLDYDYALEQENLAREAETELASQQAELATLQARQVQAQQQAQGDQAGVGQEQ